MEISTILAFAVTSMLVELTPGPNMVYLALVSAERGRKVGLAAVVGVALGLLIVGVAAAMGLTALIGRSPMLYQVLLWVGVAYFLWLAWDTWKGDAESGIGKTASQPATYFKRGLITNLLNPKAGIFYVAVLPTFINPSDNILMQAIVLSVVFVVVATTIHTTIVLFAASLQPILAKSSNNDAVRRGFAAALVAIAVWLVVKS